MWYTQFQQHNDNEELDDNVQLLREEVELPREIAGQFEVECVYDDQNEHIPTVCDDDMDAEEGDMSSTSSGRSCTSASRKAQKRPRIVEGMKPKWSRRKNYKYVQIPKDDTPTSYKALYEKIGAMNPIQLWEKFIDDEVMDLLVTSTNQYAAANNYSSFVTSIIEMKTLLDEQMIAYYGRHSCKMFIKGKPIRFGYKYWCLTSTEGYLYQFIPYAGASERILDSG
ncbi:hypothetical protein ACLKA7_004944 [Drosophila subpalustris]